MEDKIMDTPAEVSPPKPRKSRAVLVLLIISALVISAAGGGWYYFYGPCGTVRVKQASTEMKTIYAEWEDAVTLAGSTSRISLSGPLSELQTISRNTDALEVPPCLENAQNHLVTSQEHTIDGFLTFMGQGEDADIASSFREATREVGIYANALIAIAACTPFCP